MRTQNGLFLMHVLYGQVYSTKYNSTELNSYYVTEYFVTPWDNVTLITTIQAFSAQIENVA